MHQSIIIGAVTHGKKEKKKRVKKKRKKSVLGPAV